MSRLSVIDLSQLGPMQVLELLDSETILAARMQKFKDLWAERDPPAGAQYDVENLEFDPIKITEELETFHELLLRDRVNQAARAVTLAFSSGTDLDAVVTRIPGAGPRLPIIDAPRAYPKFPQDWESDDRYRRRAQLAPSTLSAHGSDESYVYWAMTADATLKDASATTVPRTGKITVTIMAGGTEPRPTTQQKLNVRRYILDQARKGLTDEVSVRGPMVLETKYDIDLWVTPGMDAELLKSEVDADLVELVAKQYWLGYDHTRMAIDKATAQPGVHSNFIRSPTSDVIVDYGQLVLVKSINTRVVGRKE